MLLTAKKSIIKFISNKKALKVTLVMCACAFICALAYLGYILYAHLNQQQIEEQIGEMFDTAKKTVVSTMRTPVTLAKPDTAEVLLYEPELSEREKERQALLEAEVRGMMTFADILLINPDFRGMIEIPGLIERQPYVMAKDNEKYLNTDFNGNRSRTGTVFLSSYNDRLLMDNNSIFFGHHSSIGTMFTRLVDYKKAQTFEKSPVIILDGLIGESTWVIFAAHVVEPDSWWVVPHNDEDDYAMLLDEILARSLFITDVDVNTNDRIITLALCDYTYEDMRFAVHARKLRPGESVPESVSAEVNKNRKDYKIPHLNSLNSLDMTGASVAVNPSSNKFYFYKPVPGGIERYAGSMHQVQGPFRALNSNGISSGTKIAAEIVKADDDGQSRAVYLVAQGIGGTPGLSLFTASVPTGTLFFEGLVTPEGWDARYPAVQSDDGLLWLLYSVPDGSDASAIYRQPVRGGNPERLYTVEGAPDARPLGVYDVYGQTVLVWYNPVSGSIDGVRVGCDEVFSIANAGSSLSIALYGAMSDLSVSYALESAGKLSFGTISLAGIPAYPPEDSAATQQPGETPTPDVTPGSDNTPEPDEAQG